MTEVLVQRERQKTVPFEPRLEDINIGTFFYGVVHYPATDHFRSDIVMWENGPYFRTTTGVVNLINGGGMVEIDKKAREGLGYVVRNYRPAKHVTITTTEEEPEA